MELKYRLAKLILAVGALLLFALPSLGQVSPSPFVVPQYFDNSGHACAGCKLASFAAGTSTPLATYSDPSGVFPNSNPVILDSAGRARIYLTGAAYKLVLSTAAGTQIWSVDQVASSNNGLLSSNNVWTGTNTWQATSNFNGPVNFNVGFASLGPNTLGGGGSISGSWSGSPIFSGTPQFALGLTTSGQIISTVASGTPPFVIASNSLVPNLDANFLEGADWATPLAIGSTLANTGKFTTLNVTTSLTLNGSSAITNVQGTDTKLLSAGTVGGGTGATLCTDANHGATTAGCFSSGFTQLEIIAATGCAPGSASSYDACLTTLTWPHSFADSSYIPTCTGLQPAAQTLGSGSNLAPMLIIASFNASSITVITQQERAITSSFGTIYCQGVHP